MALLVSCTSGVAHGSAPKCGVPFSGVVRHKLRGNQKDWCSAAYGRLQAADAMQGLVKIYLISWLQIAMRMEPPFRVSDQIKRAWSGCFK
jgi:hypothetical protein